MAKNRPKKSSTVNGMPLRRRDILRALGVGAGAAASAPFAAQAADDAAVDDKRKARYQPNSADVQNYYRVNRYPK